MAKNPHNIWNPDAAEQYLRECSAGHGGEQEERLADLMVLALKTPLLANDNYAQLLQSLPENAPNWLTEKWNNGQRDFHTFVPNDTFTGDINHVRDWITAALTNNKNWIQPEKPEPLNKLATLKDATSAANKSMVRNTQRMAAKFNGAGDAEGSIEITKDCGDGYTIVKLLTPTALKRESGMMGHCVGEGAYDEGLENSTIAIYSLRDAKNRAHATLEIDVKNNALTQCKGKENQPPIAKYFPFLQNFIKENNFKLKEFAKYTGIIQYKDHYYSIYDMPENMDYEGSLDLTDCTGLTTLPDGLSVGGNLNLYGCTGLTALPKGLSVGESLSLYGCTGLTALPDGLSVGGYLDLYGCTALTTLPDGLSVGEHLDLYGCTGLTALPDDIEVDGSIYMPDNTECKTVAEAHQWFAEHFPQHNPQPQPTELTLS